MKRFMLPFLLVGALAYGQSFPVKTNASGTLSEPSTFFAANAAAINALGAGTYQPLRVTSSLTGTTFGRLIADPVRADVFQVSSNFDGTNQDDNTKPSWYFGFDSRTAGDQFQVTRIAPGGAFTTPFTVTSAGATVTGTLTATGTVNFGTNALRTDSTHRVQIGHSAAIQGHLLEVAGGSNAAIGAFRFSADGSSATLEFRKSRHATTGSNTIVQDTDSLGSILWAGANGSGYTNAAQISAVVAGTPGASNDMPGRIEFRTSADGSGTLTTRATLDSTGWRAVATNTNDNAATGYAGEFLTGTGTSTALTTATNANVTGGSITLSAGDWEVWGTVTYTGSGATLTRVRAGNSQTSITLPSAGGYVDLPFGLTAWTSDMTVSMPRLRHSVNSSQTVYPVAQATFSAGTVNVTSILYARRLR